MSSLCMYTTQQCVCYSKDCCGMSVFQPNAEEFQYFSFFRPKYLYLPCKNVYRARVDISGDSLKYITMFLI